MRIEKAGFTLIELMITLAIVAILAVIAVPAYMNYTNKAHYAEVIQAAAAYKTVVATCGLVVGDLTECTAGKNGVPEPTWSAGINKIDIKSGVITAEGKGNVPLNATYVLTASLNDGGVSWIVSGTCQKEGLC